MKGASGICFPPRAEECRLKVQSFQDEKVRTQMLQLAADYNRKARRAEALEVVECEKKDQ